MTVVVGTPSKRGRPNEMMEANDSDRIRLSLPRFRLARSFPFPLGVSTATLRRLDQAVL